MFAPSISLGRVAGVEVGLNWSWLLIVALIVLSLGAQVFPTQNPGLSGATYVAMAAAGALLFFGSLFLHELGHAIQARREGMEIEGITLWLFGGVARFKGMFPSAGAEFRIAIAGPLVTLFLGGSFLLVAELSLLPSAVDGVVTWLGFVNIFLLVFNMLPALPLDGGRVLRATVWYLQGDFARATRFAGSLGRAFGQVMIAIGAIGALVYGAPGALWLALIGWFLMGAAGAEVQLVAAREALVGLSVADAMTRNPVLAPASSTIRQFLDEVFAPSRHSAYPVVDDGRVIGLLSFRSVAAVSPSDWDRLLVVDRMQPLREVLLLEETLPLADALLELMDASSGRAIVCEDQAPVGLVSLTDVQRLLELRQLTVGGQPRSGGTARTGQPAT